MQRESGAAGTSGWTLMLADVVALMLAFFVLTFSMRELVEDDPPRSTGSQPIASATLLAEAVAAAGTATDPGQGVPLALASNESRIADQLQAPEREAANTPSLAYLAAIIQGDGSEPSLAGIRHDDTMLMVELPDLPDDGSEPLTDATLRPLLTLAFLARRFDLAFAVALPAGSDATLVDGVARALLLREQIVDATGMANAPEVTFAAAEPAPTDPALRPWAALLVKTADGAAAGQKP